MCIKHKLYTCQLCMYTVNITQKRYEVKFWVRANFGKHNCIISTEDSWTENTFFIEYKRLWYEKIILEWWIIICPICLLFLTFLDLLDVPISDDFLQTSSKVGNFNAFIIKGDHTRNYNHPFKVLYLKFKMTGRCRIDWSMVVQSQIVVLLK